MPHSFCVFLSALLIEDDGYSCRPVCRRGRPTVKRTRTRRAQSEAHRHARVVASWRRPSLWAAAPMQRIRRSLSRRSSKDSTADGVEAEAEAENEPLRRGSHREEGESVVTLELSRVETNELLGIEVSDDNRVIRVHANSVAYRAGLSVGDEVTKVDGLDLEGTPLPNLQADMDAGRTVMLTVRRGVPHDAKPTFTPRRSSAEL